MGGWVGGIGIKAKLRPAGAGAWPELGKMSEYWPLTFLPVNHPNADRLEH